MRNKRTRREEVDLTDDKPSVEVIPTAISATTPTSVFLVNAHIRAPWPKIESQLIRMKRDWDSDTKTETAKAECT